MGRSRTLLLAMILLAPSWTAGRAVADESYYILVFASESHPKIASKAHTWATFVRADAANSSLLDVHTISWLPRTLKVHTFAPCPEPGGNLELHQTINIVRSDDQTVAMWGPYPISPEIYARSLEVKGTLESGVTQYRAISPATDLRISNCTQAVLFVGPELGQRPYPLARTGHSAASYIASHVAGRSPSPRADDSWLVPALGLDRYPIHFSPGDDRRECDSR